MVQFWRVTYLLSFCLFLSLYFPSPSRSQCSPTDSRWDRYSLSVASQDFDGTPTNGCTTSCNGPSLAPLAHQLANGDMGTQALNISVVNAWDQTVTITIQFTAMVSVRGINLYFYHIPSRGIGLPYDISIQSGAEYALEGNLDLSQDDNQLRNVTLVPATVLAQSASFVITFTISNTDNDPIDWLLLTEMEFCTQSGTGSIPIPQPITFSADTESSVSPSTINSTITLTCSVATEGRYEWTWTGPVGVNLPPFHVLNAGRTSTLTFSELSGDNARTYQCQATHTYGTSPPSASFDITLSLSGTIQASSTMVTVSDNDETATLSCMLYGYLRPVPPEIIWEDEGTGETISNNSMFMITTEDTQDQDRMIQNGGTDPIPGLISTLTVNLTTLQSIGTQVYSCSSEQIANPNALAVIQLDPSGTSTTTPPSPVPIDNSLAVIIVVIVGVIVLLVITIVVVVIIIVCIKKRSQRAQPFIEDYDYDNKDPLYQEVIKPLPPPLPARFPSVSAADIGPYAVVENGFGGGHMELVNMNGEQRNSIHDSTPQRLKSEPGFLRDNPLYASADNIDKTFDTPSLPRKRMLGSVSSMGEMSNNSTQGSILNIYARPFKAPPPPIPDRPPTPQLMDDNNVYSEPLSPSMLTEKRYSTPPGMSPSAESLEVCPASSIYAYPQPLLREEGPVEIAPKQVKEVRSLGVGQFGQVVLAETVGLSLQDLRLSESNNDRNIAVSVAIKRLKPDADEYIKEAFEKEIKFMSRLNHKNVVRLLGICPYGSCFIVMEYMENGDLNQYLHKHSEANDRLSPDTLLYMATQISSGMMYLATLNFIHRDLATRNCLVGSNSEVKIADFGMSRSLYSSYYYRIRGRAMLPIRWMANECFYGRFSEKTDIWAFGVTMWEIFTFGIKQPYDEMTDQEVIDDAIKGPDRQVPIQPDYCPDEVYDVMLRCWVDEPDDRANFEEVHSSLASIYEHTDL